MQNKTPTHYIAYHTHNFLFNRGTYNKQKVAVKKIQKGMSESFSCEKSVLLKCNHENIVTYHGIVSFHLSHLLKVTEAIETRS